MQKKTYSISFITLLLLSLSFITACAKQNSTRGNPQAPKTALQNNTEAKPQQQNIEPLELEATSTDSDEEYTTITPNNSTDTIPKKRYEKTAKTVQTKQATILLDQVKITNVSVTYDSSARKFSVAGHAFISDENKKDLADTTFSLMAIHAADDGNFSLANTDSTKTNSNEKPVVRAEVTCLSIHEDDTIDCTNAVVDFIIAYKKNFYSEQFVTKKQVAAVSEAPTTNDSADDEDDDGTDDDEDNAVPVADATKMDQTKTSSTDAKDNIKAPSEKKVKVQKARLQKEGPENSISGRFQGKIKTTDLSKVFDADDEIQKVLVAPVKIETPKTEIPRPDASKKTDPNKSSDKKEEPKKEVIINPNISLTANNNLRPVKQAIGEADSGYLNQASSLMDKQNILKQNAFFEVVFPDRARFYTTYEMSEMISRVGTFLNTNFKNKLFVSDISKPKGGLITKLSKKSGKNIRVHASHQIGIDADLGYPTANGTTKFPVVVNMASGQYDAASFSIAKTYALFKFAFTQSDIKVDRIFADKKIKKVLCDYAKAKGELSGKDKEVVQELFKTIEHIDGHGDHFHLRLKCSDADPACRDKRYLPNTSCS
ncbi:MAG: penicillin-insensitive murein endopeptidase [Pseudobdellovibrio sp.]